MFSALFSLRPHRTRSSLTLTELPSDFILRVFQRLESVQDVISLQSTCKGLLEIGRSRGVWTERLHKEYGLRLEADGRCDHKALQDLYRDTSRQSKPVRYWGVYTDGGCDNAYLQYWVDNMFVPNHWEAFCSEFGKNVNCVGVLVDGELEKDVQKQEERNYMIHKCRIPASRVFNENHHNGDIGEAVKRLQGWSQPELVHFMIALYHDMEAGGVWGELLLHGVPHAEIADERIRLRDFVHRLEETKLVESAGIKHVLDDPVPILAKYGSPTPLQGTQHRCLYDTTYTAIARQQPEAVVAGVIESVKASRFGAFSCPVATGVLFVGQMNIPHFATSHISMTDAIKELCASEASVSFDDLSQIEMIQAAVAEKKLPPICQRRSCAVGQWVEFSRDYTNKALEERFGQLRPVVWFHFYTKEELQNGELNAGEDTDDEDEAFEFVDSDSDDSSADSLPTNIMSEDEDMVEDLENEIVQNVLEDLPILGNEMDAGEPDAQQPAPNKDTLEMRLSSRVGGNIVVLKLIRPEDLMEEYQDRHSEPNIDINSLVLEGKKITLPVGVRHLL